MPNQFFSPEGDLENYFVTEYWLIDQYVGDTLWTWGANPNAQLGINNTADRNTPVTTFAGGTNWKSVACGLQYTSAIKTDGTLWIWGRNNNGQLGINDILNRTTPVTTFLGGTNWKSVDCGDFHTAAIKTDGTLWTWGNNISGALGINASGPVTYRTTPVTTFLGGTNWKQVSCGGYHTSAIKTDGTLWIWGRNNNGQLGINNTADRNTPVTTFAGGTNWKSVACGAARTSAIKTDGTLWTWGANPAGQLGINDTTDRSTPVTTFLGGTDWKSVDCAGDGFAGGHTAAIKTDGTLWTWGSNNNGQLGINDTLNRTTPVTTFAGGTNWKSVACIGGHTAAIKTDGTLWTWGFNGSGALGINASGPGTYRTTPVTTFLGGTNWKQVACGGNITVGSITAAITSGTDPTYFIT